jgi:hypothetical protein
MTSAQAGRNLYVDPYLVPRLKGRRAVIVDDTISTGATALAAIQLTRLAGGAVARLRHEPGRSLTRRPRGAGPQGPPMASFVFQSPHFAPVEGGCALL